MQPNSTYYAAVSYAGNDPHSSSGAMWLPAVPGERAPEGPGAAGALAGWAGTPSVQGPHPYHPVLTSVMYCDVAVDAAGNTWGKLKVLYRD